MRRFVSPRAARLVTLLIAAGVGVGALMPLPQLGPPGGDKVMHVLAFAALAFPTAAVRPRDILVVAPLLVIYGGAIELVQPRFNRHAEWADFWANCAGVALGSVLGYLVWRLSARFRPGGTRAGDR